MKPCEFSADRVGLWTMKIVVARICHPHLLEFRVIYASRDDLSLYRNKLRLRKVVLKIVFMRDMSAERSHHNVSIPFYCPIPR